MNYSLLLLAHIICADQQIHSEEVRYLDELIKNNGADTATTEAIESILSQAENCLFSQITYYLAHQKFSAPLIYYFSLSSFFRLISLIREDRLRSCSDICSLSNARVSEDSFSNHSRIFMCC